MLLHSESYPIECTCNPVELSEWLTMVHSLGEQAQEFIEAILCPDEPNKSMSQSVLTNQKVSKKVKVWDDQTLREF